MKIKNHSHSRILLACIFFGTSFALLAWAGSPGNSTGRGTIHQDTVPVTKEQKRSADKDLDKELRQLENAKKQLEELKNKNWDKIQQDVEEAIKKIDLEKIRLQAEETVRKIDMEKIGKEIEESLRKIDFKKIEQDIEAAMDEVSKIDRDKIKRELQKAQLEVDEHLQKKEWAKEMEEVKKINMKEIQEEMENVKKEMSRVKEEIRKENLDIKESMRSARTEIDRAQEDLKGYQEMIYQMEKEGLLNTKEDYTIENNAGELLINGKKQPTEITNKYKKYFGKDRLTIKKRNGDLKIDMD